MGRRINFRDLELGQEIAIPADDYDEEFGRAIGMWLEDEERAGRSVKATFTLSDGVERSFAAVEGGRDGFVFSSAKGEFRYSSRQMGEYISREAHQGQLVIRLEAADNPLAEIEPESAESDAEWLETLEKEFRGAEVWRPRAREDRKKFEKARESGEHVEVERSFGPNTEGVEILFAAPDGKYKKRTAR